MQAKNVNPTGHLIYLLFFQRQTFILFYFIWFIYLILFYNEVHTIKCASLCVQLSEF